jgi:hypothetical protein
MPSSPHEVLHQVFRQDTALPLRVLQRALGIPLTGDDVKVTELNVDLTEAVPLERRCDTLLMAECNGAKYIFIVEAQNDRDEAKRSSWPYYIAYLHAKYKCHVNLLVFTSNSHTDAWAGSTIEIGLPNLPSMRVYPTPIGPNLVPKITDQAEADEDPYLTMLSALVHRHDEYIAAILNVLANAFITFDKETAADLATRVEAGLGDTVARQIWRNLMTIKPFDYTTELEARGEAKGEAKALLMILQGRHFAITDQDRERITSCTDVQQLEAWIDRSITATSIEDVFD